MDISSKLDDGHLTISLCKNFDSSSVLAFRKAYLDVEFTSVNVDFRNTDYMDSSGLGMLANMKKQLPNKPIKLVNCKSSVKKIFIIARFEQQFHIE